MFWFIGKFKKGKEKRSAHGLSKGFSLLELIVVIAIFLIITGVVIADIPNFREKSSLDLTISEVATYIRGGQVFSSAQLGSLGQVSLFYGINFDKGRSDYYLYDSKDVTQQIESYRLNGFLLDNVLLREDSSYNCDISNVKIEFKSNPYLQNIGTVLEALVKVDGIEKENFEYLDLQIKGIRNNGLTGCLRVYRNGQVTNSSCDSGDSFDQCPS